MKEKSRKNALPGILIVSFLGALAIFFVLLNMEKKVLSDYEKESCVIAKTEIPVGKVITEENYDQFFTYIEMDKNAIPSERITEAIDLLGKQTKIRISKGMPITECVLQDYDAEITEMEWPVLVGVRAGDLCEAVNGILRFGDHVDLYMMEEEIGELTLFCENVLIQEVFDSNGGRIMPEDNNSSAARINLLLEKSQVRDFYELLNNGSLRMVKVWKEE